MKTSSILLLLFVMLFSACQKDAEISTPTPPVVRGEIISSKLTGQVVDQAGQPVIDANVKFQQSEVITNEDGFFSFATMDLNSTGQLLTIEKSGFFKSYKKIIPTKNQTFQKIGLVTKSDPTGNFSANNGGSIAKLNGEKVTFQPNSIRTETNQDYQGTVTAFTHHFDPEDPSFYESIPGDLSAIDEAGTSVQLATYSMILVELFGENGEPLNLKENTTATIEFPIKGSAANAAPDLIPLWFLDENTGTWMEEGQATKQGDVYIGEVAHFSFWNCDVPFDFVYLDGTLVDLDGNPLANQRVSIEIVNGGAVQSTYTNLEGNFAGGIPKDELLILSVVNFCGEELFNENIGPFNTDQTITLPVDHNETTILLTGSVNNCAGEAVENGYAVVKRNTGLAEVISLDSEGNFSYSTAICANENMQIYGVDLQSFRSPEVTISNTGQSMEDVGTLVTCDEITTFVSVSVNGGEEFLYDETFLNKTELTILESTSTLTIDLGLNDLEHVLGIVILNPNLGTNEALWVFYKDADTPDVITCGFNGNSCDFTIELTKLEEFAGGFVGGTATGTLIDDNGETLALIIEFNIPFADIEKDYQGIIWEDLNENGIRDQNETGVQGVSIQYQEISSSGEVIATSTANSNSDGGYRIRLSEINDGILRIVEGLPAGYVTTLQNQGNDESLDSDFPQGGLELNFSGQDVSTLNKLDSGIHPE